MNNSPQPAPKQLSLQAQIEGVLFVEAKAVSISMLAQILNQDKETVTAAVHELSRQHDIEHRGVRIVMTSSQVQMTTAPELHEIVADIVKDERTGELTKPSLETLAIIAYRSPVSKAQLEMIRGVNCTMILRNLLIRGLIREIFDKKTGISQYDVTPEYLQLLGVSSSDQLPNYGELSREISLGESLAEMEDPEDFFAQLKTADSDINSTTTDTQ